MSDRISTGFFALDRMLGGGLVPGSLVLLSGAIGIGKSTLMLQVIAAASRQNREVLYVSSEQDVDDILDLGYRIGGGVSIGMVAHERNLDEILVMVGGGRSFGLVVVDTINSLHVGSWDSSRTATEALVNCARENQTTIVVVDHSEGLRRGHVADVHLQLAPADDGGERVLVCRKNRHGSDRASARFKMTDYGFIDLDIVPSRRAWRFFESVAAVFDNRNERLYKLWMMRSMAREAWLEAGGCEACGGTAVVMGGYACEAKGVSHAAGMDPMIVALDDARVQVSRWSDTFDRSSQ